MIWSQQASPLRVVAEREPEIEGSLLRDTFTSRGHREFLCAAHEYGARGVSAHWQAVTPMFAARARESGLAVYSWSRSPCVPSDKLALLDGLVTDWPAAAQATARATS
jgi:hypothetical protein